MQNKIALQIICSSSVSCSFIVMHDMNYSYAFLLDVMLFIVSLLILYACTKYKYSLSLCTLYSLTTYFLIHYTITQRSSYGYIHTYQTRTHIKHEHVHNRSCFIIKGLEKSWVPFHKERNGALGFYVTLRGLLHDYDHCDDEVSWLQ